MRKKSIPILLTLITGLIFGPVTTVSAAVNNNGSTWWSISELLDYYSEVESERIEVCSEDFGCAMDFEMEHFENSEKYRAMHNVLESQILVTAINPTEETITVLFYDEDMMLKQMGIHEHLELEYLYFGWFDEQNDQVYYHDYESLTGPAKGLRLLYVYNSQLGDPNIITPWQEIEIPVDGSNLIDNTTGKINYAIFAKNNMFNAQGIIDYSSCLSDANYTYGAECRLMSSGDMGMSYFLPRAQILIEDEPAPTDPEPISTPVDEQIGILTDEPTITSTDESSITPTDEPTITPVDESATILADEQASAPIEESIASTEQTPDPIVTSPETSSVLTEDIAAIIEKPTILQVRAPETGAAPSREPSATEFPWWLGAIIVINGLTLAWLFAPIRPETPKKSSKKLASHRHATKTQANPFSKNIFSSKKYSKTLDKIQHLR